MACLNCGTGNCACGNSHNEADIKDIDKIVEALIGKPWGAYKYNCICEKEVDLKDNFCSDCGFDLRVDLESFSDSKWDYVIPEDTKDMKKIYIAGPMRYIDNFNFPAFLETEALLKDKGFIVFNPCRNPLGLSLKDLMQVDMLLISQCDAIYMLQGWEESSGAFTEKTYAKMIGLEVIYEGI